MISHEIQTGHNPFSKYIYTSLSDWCAKTFVPCLEHISHEHNSVKLTESHADSFLYQPFSSLSSSLQSVC